MKPIRWRSLGLRPFDHQQGAEGWAFALVLMGTMASSACWLDKGIVDLPAIQDAATPPSTGSGGCKWVAGSGTSCTLTDVACNQRTACPPSWMRANSPGSCPEAGASLLTETCDGAYRWSLSSSDGTLIVACYYDMSNGLLAGIDSQLSLPCGTHGFQFGTIPRWCHYDAGVEVQQITCAKAGSGGANDGGSSQSCDGAPCYGGG
jgi:hypothetical protein